MGTPEADGREERGTGAETAAFNTAVKDGSTSFEETGGCTVVLK